MFARRNTFIIGLFVTICVVISSTSGLRAQEIPTFNPLGSWNVSKTNLSQARGLSGVQLPCVMAATFDNGYVLRLSGGGQRIMALAIDFRQDVFRQGRKYPVKITLGNSGPQNLSATAFSKSILIFNMRKLGSVYAQLAGAQTMMLDIDGNAFRFNLGNIAQSVNQLEQCYNPSAAKTKPAVPKISKAVTPMLSKADSWTDKVTPEPVERENRLVQVPSVNSTQLWTAKSGDDLKQTLMTWSRRAGVTLDWQAENSGAVVGDIQVNGTFEDAVQALMAQNSAALGVNADFQGTGRRAPQRISPMTSAPNAPQRQQARAAFSAPAGVSLQVVLAQWSKQAGVDFIWNANQDFKVKAPVSGSSFEAALQSLLGQYVNDKYRPAAALNNDPNTKQRLLSIDATHVR